MYTESTWWKYIGGFQLSSTTFLLSNTVKSMDVTKNERKCSKKLTFKATTNLLLFSLAR